MGEHDNTHRTKEELEADIASNSGNSEHNNSSHIIDVEASVVNKSSYSSSDIDNDDVVSHFSRGGENGNASAKFDAHESYHVEHNHNSNAINTDSEVVDHNGNSSATNADSVSDEQGGSTRREIVLVNDTNDIEQIETDDISDDYLIRPDKPTYMPRYLAMLAKTIIAVKGTLKAWRYQNSITYIEGLLYEDISEDRRDFLTDLRNEKQGELKELQNTMKDLLSLPSNQIVNEKYKQTLMLVDDNTDINNK